MSEALNLIKKIMDQANPLAAALKNSGNKEVVNPNPSPFMERVRESHANLAAKTAKLKSESRNIDAINPNTPDVNQSSQAKVRAKAKPTSNSTKDAGANKLDNDDNRSGNKLNDIESRPINKTKNSNPKSSESTRSEESNAQTDNQAKLALKDRLEKMGVSVTDEQLSDADFLKDMLQFIQGMNLSSQGNLSSNGIETKTGSEIVISQNLDSGSNNLGMLENESRDESINALNLIDENDDSPAKSGPSSNQPISKNLNDLIQDRIAEINKNSETGSGSTNMTSTAAQLQKVQMGQEIQRSSIDDSISNDPIPASDLDKLRVMQAAGLQPNSDSESSQVENSVEEVQDVQEISSLHAPSGTGKSENMGGKGKGSENFNQNQTSSEGSSNPNSLSPTQGTKDGLTGAQFHQTMENVKPTEAKNASDPIWTPHKTAFEHGVLQQISKKLSAITHLSGGQISLQLEPENLGKVRIGMGMKDGVMSAHIGVENDKVREIVAANLSNLRETLESQGIKLQSLDVSVDQQHSSLFNPDGSNSQAFFQGRRSPSENIALPGEATPSGLEIVPESDTGRRLGYNTLEYIG